MYQSPIEVITQRAVDEINEQTENNIMLTLRQYVKVDKDELIKALNYDRCQYDKGYWDGWNDCLNSIFNE